MFKNLCCVGFLLLFSFVNYGQSGSNNNISLMNFKSKTNIIPPSPNAASLAKYAEIPVNSHTGIPQISAPIFEWKSKVGQSSVNINLSYHAGGIKVEDVASNVGVGWALNAAGVITRSVRGLPDDAADGFINTPVIPEYDTKLNTGNYYLNPPSSIAEAQMDPLIISPLNILAWFTPNTDPQALYNYSTGMLDTEQDLFYYNFCGYSGKFVIDKNGIVNKIDVNPLEIEITYSYTSNFGLNNLPIKKITGFIIWGDNGIKYLFNLTETSSTLTTINNEGGINDYQSFGYISSYYLTQAIDLNSSDIVNYEYETRQINYIGGWNESIEYFDKEDPTYLADFNNLGNSIYWNRFSSLKNTIDTRQIKNILLSDGSKINFIYDMPRDDVDGDKALTKIILTDGIGTIKTYQLDYSYFNSINTVINPMVSLWQYPYEPPDHFNKRLRLDKIKLLNSLTATDNISLYRFEYNDTLLPPRNSREIDFWGYYFGPNRYSYTLIPQLTPLVPEPMQTEGLQLTDPLAMQLNNLTDGADRKPDELYAKASILKKIFLPTGGCVTNELNLR